MIKQFNSQESAFHAFDTAINTFRLGQPTPEVLESYNYEKKSKVCYAELNPFNNGLKTIIRLYDSTNEVEVTVKPCNFTGEIGDIKSLAIAERILEIFDEFILEA